METQTVEQFLFEQLEKITPGKYTLANVLQLFKSKLRFTCDHLKGGRTRRSGFPKDYNLSVFTFPTGVTEIKCLYGCGLKIRSTDTDKKTFSELMSIFQGQSTNTRAQAEYGGIGFRLDPEPAPTYTDAYRQRIKDSTEILCKTLERQLELGIIKSGDLVLGGIFPHPDPVEAPNSKIERYMAQDYLNAKTKPVPTLKNVTVTTQDSVPALKPVDGREGQALEPVVTNTSIRKARKTNKTNRKTQSRRKTKKKG